MQRAKMYIDKLANGIDPLTDAAELSEMLNAWAEQSENIITATLTVTNMTSGATIIRNMMKHPVL